MTTPDRSHDLPEPEAHLPKDHWPLPALDEIEPPPLEPSAADYVRMQASEEFTELKRRFRTFAFPMTLIFLLWYFSYVLLSVYAKEFMGKPAFGLLNMGMVIGLLQFASTFVITALYIRHANKNLDPIAEKLRAQMEANA